MWFLESASALSVRIHSPLWVALHNCASMDSSSHMYCRYALVSLSRHEGAACRPTSLTPTSSGFPRRSVSFHSQMTTPTVGSSTSLFLSPFFRNLTNMKGSTLPPQDFLLYMPEHFWPSFWLSVMSMAATAVTLDSSSRAKARHGFMLPQGFRPAGVAGGLPGARLQRGGAAARGCDADGSCSRLRGKWIMGNGSRLPSSVNVWPARRHL